MKTRRVVGIDLGTSNTVVASAGDGGTPEVTPVVQRSSVTTVEARALFPSCAYAASEGEVEPDPRFLEQGGWVLGELARARGVEVPQRLVSSSKSWLCHPRADKTAPILPWGVDDVPKLSPVDVAARLLTHVRSSWDAQHPDAALAEQDVVLTVPASFDDVARELTLRAAELAGLRARLLEEPLAAFYHAMARGQLERVTAWMRKHQRERAHVLVCDVGGGTTDLSLLEVTSGREVDVKRVAVGRHLLLGGDNMDLALAHLLEPRLAGEGQRLESRELFELTLACRRAKEQLLSAAGPSERKITLLPRGGNLFAGLRSAVLTREEVERVVLEGFFPKVEPGALPGRARVGLVALGLPYERDVALTRHVAAFVARHVPAGEAVDAVLLNGGVFHSQLLGDALLAAVAALGPTAPLLLDHADPDTAVALGAVSFGLALRGQGRRVSAGTAKSYFIAVGRSDRGRPLSMCVIPQGAEEGVPHRAHTVLRLLLGKPARFDLFTSDRAGLSEAGTVIEIDEAEFDQLPPLTASVPGGSAGGTVEVTLESELTPVGTLELHCVAKADAALRYRLAFDLRPREDEGKAPSSIAPASMAPSRRPASAFDDALAAITKVFGKGSSGEPKDAKNLARELERFLGDRDGWNSDTSRALADRLIEHLKGRRRTLDHERVFFHLLGFCLRPGMGAPGDAARCAAVGPLFMERLAFPKESRGWQQFFVCFRRVAAGLDEALQVAMRNDLDPFIAPSELKLKKPKTHKPEASDYEMIELCAHLEHLPPIRRSELGSWILERTWTKRDGRLWAAIGRLGARVPAYASVHRVINPNVVEKWIDQLLRDKWADLPTAPKAMSELARMTGDRARDIAPALRSEVVRRLEKEGVGEVLLRPVREVVEVGGEERATFFGERLPPGLSLALGG